MRCAVSIEGWRGNTARRSRLRHGDVACGSSSIDIAGGGRKKEGEGWELFIAETRLGSSRPFWILEFGVSKEYL
jgi:hypothetical protein